MYFRALNTAFLQSLMIWGTVDLGTVLPEFKALKTGSI
jgi:hypothetical protein